MLLKCCTQYYSKFGKLSNGHRTGNQFSFQSQRRAMPKNVQTTIRLHSFHMLARLCSKFFKLGLSNMWTEKFQMYSWVYKKAEEAEIKLPTLLDHGIKQGNSRKRSTSASLTPLKLLAVWIMTNCGKFSKRWEYQTTLPVSWETNLYVGQEATVRAEHGTTDWFKIGKGVWQGCISSPCLFNVYAEYIMWNAGLEDLQAGIKIAREK